MKNNKTCSKCNSTDIVRVNGDIGAYGAGNNIKTGFTILSTIKVNRYICCNCGYCEEWIDKDDLSKLKECTNSKYVIKDF